MEENFEQNLESLKAKVKNQNEKFAAATGLAPNKDQQLFSRTLGNIIQKFNNSSQSQLMQKYEKLKQNIINDDKEIKRLE